MDAVMHLTRDPVPTTLAGSDTAASIAGDPIPKSTVIWDQDKVQSNLYTLATTPIVYSQLCFELESYPFEHDKQELLKGFERGFSLHYSGPRKFRESKNLKSARENPHIVEAKLSKEVALGRVAGPFTNIPFPTLRVSPVGLVPKKDGDFRLIHHLSYPSNDSVNSHTDPDICTVQYANIDQAVLMIQNLGQNALLAKTDLKSAFRLLPINPADFDLLGIKCNNRYYFDKSLPFGSKLSCALFNRFSTFLHWLVCKKSQNSNIIHYLDDFLFGGRAGEITCNSTLSIFHTVCAHLGIPIADDKTVEPTTCLTFLGIELDTVAMQMRLPQDKLTELRDRLQAVLQVKKLTLREMQSLIGLLNFVCQVVSPGRAFIRRLIDATLGIKKPRHKLRLTSSIKLDLEMWLEFLSHYNGVTLFQERSWVANDTLQFFTDSSGGPSGGFGIFFQNRWAFGRWPQHWAEMGRLRDMTFLELFPIATALSVWGQWLVNKKILFHVDNQAVVQIINKKSSKSPEVMVLVRKLVLDMLHFNINLRAQYINTKANAIADSISRCQWNRFRVLAPHAEPVPYPLPRSIWQI
jgi:hypothetical protein